MRANSMFFYFKYPEIRFAACETMHNCFITFYPAMGVSVKKWIVASFTGAGLLQVYVTSGQVYV